jgi:putative flippase GtrA
MNKIYSQAEINPVPKTGKKKTIVQVLKFVVVGVLNTFVDLAILNLLIWLSGIGQSGPVFTLFKAISFTVAVVNSYYFNRLWVFRGDETKKVGTEFTKFIIISVVGAFVNVGVATLVVTYEQGMVGFIHMIPLISPTYDWFVSTLVALTSPNFAVWPTVAALFGTLAGLVWNFLGYKFIVFVGNKNRAQNK